MNALISTKSGVETAVPVPVLQIRMEKNTGTISLIDDASRFITGIDVFYNDNFINLMSVTKYARP